MCVCVCVSEHFFKYYNGFFIFRSKSMQVEYLECISCVGEHAQAHVEIQ